VLGGGVGILAGMLGVGGGVIIVPALAVLFAKQQFHPEHVQHLVVGTSLATIVFTSIASMKAHHERESVDWAIVRRMAPAIILGTLAGSLLASHMSTRLLQWVFVVFLYVLVVQMFMKAEVKPAQTQSKHTVAMTFVGSLIGALSSMVGIGGGSMVVPFLSWCHVSMRTAIGTSSAIGLFIALTGSFGSIVFAKSEAFLPKYSFGYIYLPALAGIAVVSMLTAPLGARLAHRLPVTTLKRGFACLLLVIATKLLINLVHHA
jgi:uncharacterized membrane protein YfcA